MSKLVPHMLKTVKITVMTDLIKNVHDCQRLFSDSGDMTVYLDIRDEEIVSGSTPKLYP